MTDFAGGSLPQGSDATLAATGRFYGLLDALAAKHGGPRSLGDATGRMTWPRRGVYFSSSNPARRGPVAARVRAWCESERTR